ncbi:MAG: metallophosphatase family protein [Candidatus Korarchaeum sp.]|nr:metallophosphatase family protein [Candidatus Korarchaeum sp.]MDW8036355.1 metallophosphoesterase family protein [Candidatus Korarchaeum sp.]
MRWLILSDVHGNYDALKRVLDVEEYDEVIFLGDAVDYGPQPAETLDLLREVSSVFLKGNHDAAAAHGISCMCREELRPLSEYTRENVTLRTLSKEDLRFLAKLPEKYEFSLGELHVYAVHASPKDRLYGYLMPDMSDEELEGQLFEVGLIGPRKLSHELVLTGHTHRAMIRELKGSKILNSGSVGQPRDGDPRASYALLEDGKLELRRLSYDVEGVVRKIRELGLERWAEDQLILVLRTGSIGLA